MEKDKARSGISEVKTLFNSRRKSILIKTFEEARLESDLKDIALEKGYDIISWTVASGGVNLLEDENNTFITDPVAFMNYIEDYNDSCIFILKDFHNVWEIG